jgi:outer membrane protein OmpA-like peptidoglycan-associated protein
VPDYLDKCPDTPKEAYGKVDSNGCPIDSDGDGVPDYLDKCPDTPKEAIGYVDKDGCPRDSDGDGVPDYHDKCKDTPTGVKVDTNGCPMDTDGDGVPDYLDKCPDTPKEANRMVDKNGCLLDSDGDGVPDYLDLCPNTPVEAKGFIDKNGCLLDTDSDGVPDYLDKCPDTPIAARGMVDQNGCPRDTDGDGVPDYLDKCPTIPGVASNNGCPEIKKEVKTLFQKALQGIQFEPAKFKIKPVSYGILNQIANVLILNPTYLIEIQGHTDNAGRPESNLALSDKRAQAVKDYLFSKGVETKRMNSHGYGDTVPVASNKTPKGRALNRRVEFVISFEQVVQQ